MGHFLFQNVPTFCENDVVFSEYAYTRFLASQIQERLLVLNLDARLLVPEMEGIPLPNRCRRVKQICKESGVSLISVAVGIILVLQ